MATGGCSVGASCRGGERGSVRECECETGRRRGRCVSTNCRLKWPLDLCPCCFPNYLVSPLLMNGAGAGFLLCCLQHRLRLQEPGHGGVCGARVEAPGRVPDDSTLALGWHQVLIQYGQWWTEYSRLLKAAVLQWKGFNVEPSITSRSFYHDSKCLLWILLSSYIILLATR